MGNEWQIFWLLIGYTISAAIYLWRVHGLDYELYPIHHVETVEHGEGIDSNAIVFAAAFQDY